MQRTATTRPPLMPNVSQRVSDKVMSLLLRHDGREYHRLALARPAAFATPFEPRPYPCLLWDHGGDWTPEERDALTRSVIATDCRYAVCGGAGCERWHDEIDESFIQMVPEKESDERFIITSWHTAQPPLEVAWYFAWNTNFEDHDFQKYLLLEIGIPRPDSDLVLAVTRSVTESERVVGELDESAG